MRSIGVGVLLTLAVTVPPVSAEATGRPSSVVVVAPETGASAVLHWHEVEYAELSSLVKSGSDAAVRAQPPGGIAAGPSVIVTWLADDTDAWRVDRIYYEAPGQPWIRTAVPSRATAAADRASWHRSRDGDRLLEVLRGLRVVDVAYVGREVLSSAETTPPGDPAGQSRSEQPSGWLWGVGGLSAGAVLTLGAVWLARSASRRDHPPRQQLIDL